MTLPLANTAIDVYRPLGSGGQDPYGEGYDDDHVTTEGRKARGVRAVITVHDLAVRLPASGGDSEALMYNLVADPCDLTHLDRVRDADGTWYEVLWAKANPGIGGMAHMRAGLRTIAGSSAP